MSRAAGLAVLLLAGFLVFPPQAWAQQPGEEAAGPSAVKPQPERRITGRHRRSRTRRPASAVTPPSGLFDIGNAFGFWVAGGWWMVPISFMSLVMVTVTIERSLALRRERLIPAELVDQLGRLSGTPGGFDPARPIACASNSPARHPR